MGMDINAVIVWGFDITAEDFKKDFNEETQEYLSDFNYYHPTDAYNENADVVLGVPLISTEYSRPFTLSTLKPDGIMLEGFMKALPEKYKDRCGFQLVSSVW